MNVAPQKNLADWVLSKREGTAAAEAAIAARAAEVSTSDNAESDN
jgi:hypothetical protein